MQLHFHFSYLGILLLANSLQAHAAILPLTLIKSNDNNNAVAMHTEKFGYLELKPNGSLILRRVQNAQEGNNKQNLLLLKNILNAMKLAPLLTPGESRLNIKIYGEGVEHKFPPLLENIIQRIQTYFSIYRYTDTSRPVRKDELPPTASTSTEPSEADATASIPALELSSEEVEQITSMGQQSDYIVVGEDERTTT